ncbi:MAG: PH domain-containing protein [Acidimicrobiales bacterium]|nr:PH domain-containing protein [Acidimicrobiales bacterium]
MAFPKNLLNTGEELILDLRPHWLFLFAPGAAFFGSLVVGLIAANQINPDNVSNDIVTWIAIALVVGTLVWFGWTYLKWNTTMFVLTSDRIVTRRGVLSKAGTEIPLERINTVFFSQSVFERMVGAGDLSIESAGERGSESFTDIRKPSIVQKEIYVQMEANENRKFDRMHARAPGSAPAAPEATIPEQIDQLAQLHQRGVLSDAEFARKKAELLERM